MKETEWEEGIVQRLSEPSDPRTSSVHLNSGKGAEAKKEALRAGTTAYMGYERHFDHPALCLGQGSKHILIGDASSCTCLCVVCGLHL
jgi:hypothetical protein